MAQFGRPASDITVGSWGSTPLWPKLDEASPDDGDLISTTAAATTGEVKLSAVNDPNSSAGHVVRLRARATGSGAAERLNTWGLYQGTTAIVTLNSSITRGSFNNYTISLTAVQADAITDYSDLRVRFTAAQTAGETLEISWIELETPDANQQYNQSVSGAFGPAGALLKQAEKPLSSVLSFTGVLATSRIFFQSLSGVLSFGAAAQFFQESVSGALSFAGTLIRQVNKELSGTVTSGGSLLKHTSTSISGVLSSSGALVKQAGKALAGTLSFSGLLESVKTVLKDLAGALSFDGSLTRQGQKVLGGALTSSGALLRDARKILAGTLTSGGTLAKQTAKSFSGVLSPSGVLAASKVALKALEGALSFAGDLTRQGQKALTGGLSPSGAITRQVGKALFGALSPGGSLSRMAGKGLAGVLAFSGAVSREIRKVISGALSFLGTLVTQLIQVGAVNPGRATVSDVALGGLSLADALLQAAGYSDGQIGDLTISDTDNG